MENNKRILIKFSLYFLMFLLIIIIGISNVFADTYSPNEYYAELYNNLGPTLNKVNTYTEEINGEVDYYYGFLDLTGNSAGGAWIISSPIPIIDGHTYSMTINTYAPGCGTTTLSTYNRIGLGSTINWAKTSYQENTLASELYSKFVNNTYLQYVFKAETNASYIAIPFATTLSCTSGTVHLKQVIIDDLGTDGITESTINNSLTNQTNELNSSIQESTDTITGAITDIESNINSNIDDMESAIIDSNKETQEVIKDQFNTCRDSYNLANYKNIQSGPSTTVTIINDGFKVKGLYAGILNVSGLKQNTNYYLQYQTENITGNIKMVVLFSGGQQSGSFKSFLNGIGGTFNTGNNTSIDIWFYSDSGSSNFEVNFTNIMLSEGTSSKTYEPYGEEICSNKLDEQTNAINGLNDNLNNDNTDGATSEASDFFSDFSTNTFGLTSIITAPLNLIQSLTSKTCSPLHIPLPYLNNKYLDLPCMSTIYSQHFGSFFTIYQTITYGIIAYWVVVRIFNHVKDFKNPEHDEIEVVDL